VRADLYPLFGGYWGYQAAPLREVLIQRAVWAARHSAEAQINAEQQAEIESYRR